MEEIESLAPEKMDTTFKDKLLVGQKMFRLAALDVLSSVREAFVPIGIEEDEHLLAYLGRRAEERKEADEAKLRRYILENQIGSSATRARIELGFRDEFFSR